MLVTTCSGLTSPQHCSSSGLPAPRLIQDCAGVHKETNEPERGVQGFSVLEA